MKIQFKANSIAQIEAIFAYYRNLEYKIDDCSASDYLRYYPYIVINHETKNVRGNEYNKEDNGPLGEFKECFINPPKIEKVILNKEYTAEVSKDGVKVGCRVFPIDIINRLVEARDKVFNQR